MPIEEEYLLTAAELAAKTRLNVETIYRLTKSKRIPVHKFGAANRYRLSEVLAVTNPVKGDAPNVD